MAKVAWGTKGSEVDEVELDDFPTYDGPVPPAGVYRLKVSKVTYKKFSTGSKGLEIMCLIEDNAKDKKQYNGCPVWENVVDTEESQRFIRRWLDAIGATGRDWDNTVIDKENLVTKFGRITVDGLYVRALLKRGRNQSDEARAEVNRFLPKNSEASSGESGESDPDEEGEAPF